MKIKEIVVTAGRTFNHPYESYSNLRPEVEMRATIDEGEDATACVKSLQAKAEELVEDRKRIMMQQLHDLQVMSQRQQEVARLENSIKTAQAQLDKLRDGANLLTADDTQE